MIQGSRIYLRPHSLDDVQGFYALNLDYEVIKYTGDKAFESIDTAREFLKSYISTNNPGFGRYALLLKETNEYLGWCGLKEHDSFVDLGYRLKQEHWGKGFATEAALLSLNHGFVDLGLDEITGRTHTENIASIKVLEKIGMKFSGLDECEGINNARIYKINQWEYQTRSSGSR